MTIKIEVRPFTAWSPYISKNPGAMEQIKKLTGIKKKMYHYSLRVVSVIPLKALHYF